MPLHSATFGPLVAPALLVAMLLAAAGCGNPTIEPSPLAPQSLALTLFTATSTLRHTWFEVGADGELRYAGGRDAARRQGERVLTLSPQQRQEIWDIIRNTGLLEAQAGPLFPEGERVTYDFTVNTGGIDRIVRAADDEQPGLAQLHDYLFKLQTEARYKQ